ncbi:MAG: DUF885 family protein [Pseudomonadales bacterium]|nr:DUF885 family protein [Pseudomonadales bacterium]MBO6597696.1 DUF885 family protein [Pseudomonadales bacterium]MBO6657886.1 DUF885 family protein [Pseudomonadales bacterium]MBO6704011.1 DUF885 family protein [Pseudomonadales bacterium]MBO6823934.1 DUF885 family protein [Pseudomonadales bacterium]
MKQFASILLTGLLSACTSIENSTVPASTSAASEDTRHRMEEAIATKILKDVREVYITLSSSAQPSYLSDQIRLFETSVDPRMTSERVRFEKRILDHLQLQSDLSTFSSGFEPWLQMKTTRAWALEKYQDLIKGEINRLDQTIAVLSGENPESFNITRYTGDRRAQAQYPEDSFEGRQRYLDALADAMLEAQLDWYDTLENYNESELAIFGAQDDSEEKMEQMFRFSPAGLTVNLTNVDDLPEFELKAVAVYYGFPGMRSINQSSPDSLKQFLRIPAYPYGWGAYMVENIGNRDTENTIDYLLFSRMLAALALVDFNVHTGSWDKVQSVQYLYDTLPLSRHRVELMFNEITIQPGHFVATIVGKSEFTRLHQRCLDEGRGDVCHGVFNQRIVDWGPIPFQMLEDRLFQ